jgi:hypothetical protein
MNGLYYFEEGDDEMYKDIAPHLPKVVLLHAPFGLEDYQRKIESLEILGIEVIVATADLLDHLRIKEAGLFNLAVSSHEMCSDELLISELGADVNTYVRAREIYGIGLYKQLVDHGLYVNGVLYYQLRHLDNNTLVLEKMCVPLTDHEMQYRRNARQIDTACRRVISAFDARIAAQRVY